jgi:hypothetical protein
MIEPEKFYPNEQNMGKSCSYWELGGIATNCCYPKHELQGRTTCGGVIDDVCLYVKNGREPSYFSKMLLEGVKTSITDSSLLPPGDIV